MKSRFMPAALVAVLLTAFVVGVVALFQLRFNGGDIYPAYSSLRADPLGTKAYFEALQIVPGLAVDRFYRASSKLGGGRGKTLFILGLDSKDLSSMAEEDDKALQAFLYNGGRVVISLVPPRVWENDGEKSFNKRRDSKKVQSPHVNTNDVEETARTVSFFANYGVQEKTDRLFIADADANKARLAPGVVPDGTLPDTISWHSAAWFVNMSDSWRTVYSRTGKAVVIERAFGPGMLVLSSDSYFTSNEALRRERHPNLLAWLAGGNQEILFDETHLGVREDPGVAVLMRRYRLTGFTLGLLLVAALFVWQNGSSLMPPYADHPAETGGALVRGRETGAGFASLLRRNIPQSKILSVCFQEWKNACGREPRAAARMAEIECAMQAEEASGFQQPVETWRQIQRILNERH